MSTNACYGHFVCFLIRRSERRALLVGVKQILYIPSIFIVRFDEIQYKGSARIADHLGIVEFRSNWCEKELNSLWV
jgi:hypothetical protein